MQICHGAVHTKSGMASTVQCTVYTLHSVHCTLVHCAVHSVQVYSRVLCTECGSQSADLVGIRSSGVWNYVDTHRDNIRVTE